MRNKLLKSTLSLVVIFTLLLLVKTATSVCTAGAGTTAASVTYNLNLYYPSGTVARSWAATGSDITFSQDVSLPSQKCDMQGQYTVNWVPVNAEEGSCTLENAYYVDWDTRQYCKAECVPGGGPAWAWSDSVETNKCCGDDFSDPGSKTSDNKLICANNTWVWLDASGCRGDVIDVSNAMYVSNGIWAACPGFTNTNISRTPTSTQSHGFICSNMDGAYNIYECAGSGSAYSSDSSAVCRGTTEGVRNKTGDSVVLNAQSYYCVDTADKKLWSTDLDIYSVNNCEAAGFGYTGNLCCGEDPHESYNDVINPMFGANCWDERKISNNTLLFSNELVKNVGLSEWLDVYNLKYWSRTGDIGNYNGGVAHPTAVQLLNGASIKSDFIPVTDGMQYELAYYYSGYVTAKIEIYDANKNWAGDQLQNIDAVATGGWKIFNFTYMPASGNGYVKIYLSATAGQKAWFDDVSFKGGENVVSLGGQFYGCSIPANLQAKTDTQHAGALIINDAFCANRGRFYCDYSNKWLDNNGQIKNRSSASPSGTSTSCCQNSQCWNGTSCVNDQASNPFAPPYENKRCINGEWKDVYSKKTWNNEAGYCPEQQQCLVNPFGAYANNNNSESYFTSEQPQCINDGQYILDHYCENGNWTTRTKHLALTMLSLTAEYTLFCDNYENVVNHYNYILPGNKNARDYLSTKCTLGNLQNQACANQVCIMEYGSKKLVGITLNQEINAPNYKFLDVLNLSSCIVTNDGQFHPCDASNRIWYNNASKTILYSDASFSMPTTITSLYLKSLSLIFLENPILAMHALINNILQPSFDFGGNAVQFDYSFINQTKDFSHLYMLKTADKSIFALIENNVYDTIGAQTKYLVVDYTGFAANLCNEYVDRTNKYICYENDGKFYIAAKPFPSKIENSIFDLWRDFVSKLRIAGTGASIDLQ